MAAPGTELTDSEWRKRIEVELARLRADDPQAKAMARAMRGPLISGPAKAAEERQLAACRQARRAGARVSPGDPLVENR
jgi:hypothetical protein